MVQRSFVLLVVVGLLSCQTTPTADLAVFGDVHTGSSATPSAEGFAVRDGRLVAVGNRAEIEGYVGRDTEVLEAADRTVLPGLIDGHTHLSVGLDLVEGVDLYGLVGLDRWLEVIAGKAAELPAGEWIVGGRWDQALNDPPVFPTREDLDRVAPDHPVALRDVDGHAVWANTLALELAGVDASTADPMGGRLLRDEDGFPTGVFLEAGGLVLGAVPARQPEERLEALRSVQALAHSLGITGAHDMGSLGVFDEWSALAANDELHLRLWFGVMVGDAMASAIPQIAQRRAEHRETPMLALGYVKAFMDGVLSYRTASLLEPYADARDEFGLPNLETGALEELVEAANSEGLPVAVHAIGDAAVRRTLDAFEAAADPDALHPNRIEHIEVVDPSDAPRFAELGVVASMHPHHCISGIGKYNTARLGRRRAQWSFAWGRLRDEGARLALGSDWPTAPLNPFEQLYAAVVRQRPAGGPEGGWTPDNRLSWQGALRGYTLGPAEAAGWQDDVGSLEPGKWADFVVLTEPLGPPEELQSVLVHQTWVGGQRVFARGESSATRTRRQVLARPLLSSSSAATPHAPRNAAFCSHQGSLGALTTTRRWHPPHTVRTSSAQRCQPTGARR
ncbi:MAG: amidohydrolase [Acidobacteriota bacterium]